MIELSLILSLPVLITLTCHCHLPPYLFVCWFTSWLNALAVKENHEKCKNSHQWNCSSNSVTLIPLWGRMSERTDRAASAIVFLVPKGSFEACRKVMWQRHVWQNFQWVAWWTVKITEWLPPRSPVQKAARIATFKIAGAWTRMKGKIKPVLGTLGILEVIIFGALHAENLGSHDSEILPTHAHVFSLLSRASANQATECSQHSEQHPWWYHRHPP